MHVLVTGGSGFLGRAVTRGLLAAGDQVTVVGRGMGRYEPVRTVDMVTADVRDRARLTDVVLHGNFDAVCHLAALTSGRDSLADPLTYFDVNTGGVLNLLSAIDATRRAGRKAPQRLAFTSTNIVYGSAHEGALSEDLEPHPESPYAVSKVAAEQLIDGYARTGAIGAVTLRPFNIAGAADGIPDSDPGRIIPNILRAATGQTAGITLNGDGSAVRDFVHVLDVVHAVQLALAACAVGEHHVYNVGSGVGVSMAQVVTAAEQITGTPVRVTHNPPKPEPRRLTADITRIGAELGWKPERSDLRQIITDAWAAWPRN
jgi:UDP-glucose 4-epimerase